MKRRHTQGTIRLGRHVVMVRRVKARMKRKAKTRSKKKNGGREKERNGAGGVRRELATLHFRVDCLPVHIVAMAVALPPPSAGPVTKISLSLSLNNLPDLDIMSKTDAKVLVYLKSSNHGEVKIGQTEKAKDNLNPRFATPIMVDYFFETVQTLTFVVGDVDDNKTDGIGSFCCTLGSIVGARGQQLTANLAMARSTYRQATITIRAEEVRGSNNSVVFSWSGSQLDSTFLLLVFLHSRSPFISVSH